MLLHLAYSNKWAYSTGAIKPLIKVYFRLCDNISVYRVTEITEGFDSLPIYVGDTNVL